MGYRGHCFSQSILIEVGRVSPWASILDWTYEEVSISLALVSGTIIIIGLERMMMLMILMVGVIVCVMLVHEIHFAMPRWGPTVWNKTSRLACSMVVSRVVNKHSRGSLRIVSRIGLPAR